MTSPMSEAALCHDTLRRSEVSVGAVTARTCPDGYLLTVGAGDVLLPRDHVTCVADLVDYMRELSDTH